MIGDNTETPLKQGNRLDKYSPPLTRPVALRARCRRFESCLPDSLISQPPTDICAAPLGAVFYCLGITGRAWPPKDCDQLDKAVMIREPLAVRLIKQKVLGYGVRKQSYQIATNSEATEIAHTPQPLGIKETIQ